MSGRGGNSQEGLEILVSLGEPRVLLSVKEGSGFGVRGRPGWRRVGGIPSEELIMVQTPVIRLASRRAECALGADSVPGGRPSGCEARPHEARK